MQSNTSNRFQYLIPENQKEAMGSFFIYIDQIVLNSKKSWNKEFYMILNFNIKLIMKMIMFLKRIIL